MATVQGLLQAANDSSTDDSRRDAEILLCHCLGKNRTWLYTWPEYEVSPGAVERYQSLLSARRAGTPIAHLTGRREFWSLVLTVNEHTLIPRPETETLVEWALALTLPENANVLDLGTGSGAIALALASERPGWLVSGVDASPPALEVAQGNARALGLSHASFFQSDWFASVPAAPYDLIVSNPPYIAEGDQHLSRGDLPAEPRSALVAGDGGYADIALIASQAVAHLAPGGWLLLEHGFEQGAGVRDLLGQAGYRDIDTRCDLAGLERITGGRRC